MKTTLLLSILLFTHSLIGKSRDPQTVAREATVLAGKAAEEGRFSGVLLLAREDKVIAKDAWGLADREAATPNTVDTRFNIGSINKMFTKVAIAQLAQRGKLSLDDTVRKHLPDYPSAAADRITIEQLLQHRSGLGDIFGARYEEGPSRLRELKDFLLLFVSEPLLFEPGSSQKYSNGGYIVLGLIIEKLTGQKYRDYVAANIFQPAGMKDTGFWAKDEKVARRAVGYTRENKSNYDTLPGRPSSAGGAYATAEDLLRFTQALVGKKLLSEAWTNWMLFGSFEPKGVPALGVGGGAPGINASIEMADGWTVITLANLSPPAASNLGESAMGIVRGGQPAPSGGGRRVMRMRGATGPQNIDLHAPVAVPMEMQRHIPTVKAKINGQGPFRLSIDSGAAGMLRLTPAVSKQLSLETVGEMLAGDPSGKNSTSRPVVRVDSVEIGGARFSGNIEASLLERPDADGVLGLAMFSGLTVTLDYPKNEFRIARQPLPEKGEHVVPYTVERGVPEVDVDVAGVPIRADVDTGSPALLTVPASWSSRFPLGELRVVGRARTTANEFEVKGAELNGALRVAGVSVTAPRVDVVEIFPVANLGSRFLRNYALTFDVANRRMGLQ